MKRVNWKLVVVMTVLGAMLCVIAVAQKGEREAGVRESEADEGERAVTQAEVSPGALATLRKLAAGAEITEFAREIEHGVARYEASWETVAGVRIDALVTQAGALLEIEEQMQADQVPIAVRQAAQQAAGASTSLTFEKKTVVLYEVKFQKAGGQHELVLTADGCSAEGEGDKADSNGD